MLKVRSTSFGISVWLMRNCTVYHVSYSISSGFVLSVIPMSGTEIMRYSRGIALKMSLFCKVTFGPKFPVSCLVSENVFLYCSQVFREKVLQSCPRQSCRLFCVFPLFWMLQSMVT